MKLSFDNSLRRVEKSKNGDVTVTVAGFICLDNELMSTMTCLDIPIEKVCKQFGFNILHSSFYMFEKNTAHCHEGDVYDAKLGEHIAESQSKRNIYLRARNFFDYLVKGLFKRCDTLVGLHDKYNELFIGENVHIKQLGNK